MSKLCKSCGNYYEGDHCDKCGYGDPNLKTHAADKYKKPTKPERFRTEEEKELYAEWEKEKKEDTEIKRHYDPNAGKKTLAIVAVVVIGVIVAVLYKSGVIFSSTKTEVIEKYFKSIQTSDFDSFVECFPKEMKNEYEQQRTEGGYGKEQVMKEVLYGDFIESYGSDYTIDVSFGRETKLKESEYDTRTERRWVCLLCGSGKGKWNWDLRIHLHAIRLPVGRKNSSGRCGCHH